MTQLGRRRYGLLPIICVAAVARLAAGQGVPAAGKVLAPEAARLAGTADAVSLIQQTPLQDLQQKLRAAIQDLPDESGKQVDKEEPGASSPGNGDLPEVNSPPGDKSPLDVPPEGAPEGMQPLHDVELPHVTEPLVSPVVFSSAELDGGDQPWQLFPGRAPLTKDKDAQVPEAFVPADPNDPIGKRCCPGDTSGYWYYNVSSPTLLPFILPANNTKRTNAAVIVLPGGGSRFLAWLKEGTHVAKWLNSIGISAFVLKYRVPNDIGVENVMGIDRDFKPHLDAQRAMRTVRHFAPKYGFNASRVGVIGFSAGGILAARLSTNRLSQYQNIDEIDSQPFRPNFQMMIYATENPMHARLAPPTFMAVAHNDQCIPRQLAEAYYYRLSDHGVPGQNELHVFAEGRHGYGDCSMWVEGMRRLDVCEWTRNAEAFIRAKVLDVHDALMPTDIPGA